MINWRKPTIYTLLKATNSEIPQALRFFLSVEYEPYEKLKEIQEKKLRKLLRHANRYVPYYRSVFKKANLIKSSGKINLNNFKNIPPLTKKQIRKKFEHLKSTDPGYDKRNPHLNTSGGSTGEPVRFIQDDYYDQWNFANKIYYKKTFGGHEIGQKELRLWGSAKDLYYGKVPLKERLKKKLYNRIDLNCYRMGRKDIQGFVDRINKEKPNWIEAYAMAAFEIAKFINQTNQKIYSPSGIVTSTTTLHPEMKELIEKVFCCSVYNRYGSREVGDAACSCATGKGLHTNLINHYVEILNNNLEPVGTNEIGTLHITTLNNFSMPLIRYNIGDLAESPKDVNRFCSCGRGFPLIKRIIGRETDIFETTEGNRFYGGSFTRLFYLKDWCQRFQVIQKDYDYIQINILPNREFLNKFERDRRELFEMAQKLMGKDCRIEINLVDNIKPSSGGKHLYTINKIK